MTLLIVMPGRKQSESWARHLQRLDPELKVRIWPAVGDPENVDFALSWRHHPGEFLNYPNLRCIASMGAGVDHILSDPDLPPGVAVTRVVDPSMAQSMSEYVVMAVLNHSRHTLEYFRRQLARQWSPMIPRAAGDVRVGIMGMGQLGADAADRLQKMGFAVTGWRRSAAGSGPVPTFRGNHALNDFLEGTDVLVCMLPLTPETRGMLNRGLFRRLPPGAFLINVARGEHLVEEDLLEALDSGRLSGACLDVFYEEPLPEDHPFWGHPRIVLTPHISSLTHPKQVAPQVVENYRRMRRGKPLLHTVDPERGY